jgi:Lrp/AsnC family transcriptional regulator for asnA, asnC and gidA
MTVNPFSLGYKYITAIGVDTSKPNENSVKKFLESKPYVPRVFGPWGKNNFGTLLALHKVQELSEIQADLDANPMIKRLNILIWAHDANIEHPENLIIKPFLEKSQHQISPVNNEGVKLDETDMEIARTLTNSSRTSFREIAKKLDISTGNVIHRYKRIKENIFIHSTITVNLFKLGYIAGAFLFIKLANKSKTSQSVAELLKIDNIIVIVQFIGEYDLFAHLVFRNIEDYFKCMDNIQAIPFIEEANSFLTPVFLSQWPINQFACLLKIERHEKL